MSIFRPDPKPDPRPKRIPQALKRSQLKKKYKKPTGELIVFRMIIVDRGSKSQISDTPIYRPTVSNMMHVLPKAQNKFPKFILYKKNIVIGTEREHDLWDKGSREELRKLPEWNWMFHLEAELLVEYKRLHG